MGHSFDAARVAAAATARLPTVELPLIECLGLVLATHLQARSDLPSFDTSAMDGWAVCGHPPWVLGTPLFAGVPATGGTGALLTDGQAVQIATGAKVPAGTDSVLRSELGTVQFGNLDGPTPPRGQDIRRRGSECRLGEIVATAGLVVGPALLGLAAASGADTLMVIRRPTVEVFILGDELLDVGPPRGAMVRDALGPLLPGWLGRLNAHVLGVTRVPDSAAHLVSALTGSSADLVVTTGSTARGPVDHLHEALRACDAALIVDGVDVRPGQPMLLARFVDSRSLVGLPGNPLAAVSGLVTLVGPVLGAMRGAPTSSPLRFTLAEPVIGHPTHVRLVPVRDGKPVHHVGPAMLRGLAHADALAVIPPHGAGSGDSVFALALP